MKQASEAAKDTIKRQHVVEAKARLTAEWEHNRFSTPTVAVVSTTENDEWKVFYDLDSIALPNRPGTGSAKARTGSSNVKALIAPRDSPDDARFYPSDATDPYKYFSTTQTSKLAKNGDGSYDLATPVVLTVTYPQAVPANKIVVGFETSYSQPKNWSIEYSPDGSNWLPVGSNSLIGQDGIVSLWRYAGGGWSANQDFNDAVMLKAVRITVRSMVDPFAHLDVLQLGARLETDLTDSLISYGRSFEVSDRSLIAPMGKASSNTATVSLSNTDQRFNNSNTESLYHGLIDKKVKLTLDVGIDTTDQGGSGIEYFREFTMWAESWGGQESATAQVTLKDSSVFLQELKMPKVFFEDASVGAVVWQVLDLIGFTSYEYTRAAADTGQVVRFYWPENNGTVWDEFAALAEGTQTAIYFDEYDVLQIKTRTAMYDLNRQIDWNLDATPNGTKLPDVIDVEVDHSLEVNKVDVVYKPADYSDFNNGSPKMETVWEAEEETVLLRSSPIVRDLSATGTDLYIRQAEAPFWPFESMVNIRGEILEYVGKEYISYPKTGGTTRTIVKSQEEKDKIDAASSENLAWKNYFTGLLKVSRRGLLGTPATNHEVKSGDYTGLITNYWNSVFRPNIYPGRQADGYFQVIPGSTDIHTYSLVKSDTSVLGLKSVLYGAKMRFPNDAVQNTAGLFFAGDWGDAGYYLEVSTTRCIDEGEARTWRHELSLQAMPGNAPHLSVRSDNGEGYKGFKAPITHDTWYAIDVKWTYLSSTSVLITVFLDGVYSGDWFIGTHLNTDIAPPPNEGRFGMFVRGNTTADFEFLYAVAYDTDLGLNDPDSTAFLDAVSGGFTSGYIQRDWRYNFNFISPWYDGNYFPQNTNRAKAVFDEFGPQVHEVKSFEIQFKEDSIPVAHSFPFFTNLTDAACLSYESNAFGARMLFANASRDNAVIKGENKITYGPDDPSSESFFIYGRSVYQEDERTVTKTDDAGIRRRGTTETQFTSRYIQSEEAAEALGKWVVGLWGGGVEEVTANIFGNPLVQIGDLVTLNFPVKGMYAGTHRYFVVSVRNTLETGLSTELVLRRARI